MKAEKRPVWKTFPLKEKLAKFILSNFPSWKAIDERACERYCEPFEPALVQEILLHWLDKGDLRMDGFKFFVRAK